MSCGPHMTCPSSKLGYHVKYKMLASLLSNSDFWKNHNKLQIKLDLHVVQTKKLACRKINISNTSMFGWLSFQRHVAAESRFLFTCKCRVQWLECFTPSARYHYTRTAMHKLISSTWHRTPKQLKYRCDILIC